MTVAELIEILKGMPQGAEVMPDHDVYGVTWIEAVYAGMFSEFRELRPGQVDSPVVVLIQSMSSYPDGLPGSVRSPSD